MRMPRGVYDRTPEYRAKISAAMHRRHGDPVERFMSRVAVDPDGCWLWTGLADQHGYGRIHFEGRVTRAHRVSWMIHEGPIPEGQKVLHRCDTPACVRPDHLFLGTQADNMADMNAKGRGRWRSSGQVA